MLVSHSVCLHHSCSCCTALWLSARHVPYLCIFQQWSLGPAHQLCVPGPTPRCQQICWDGTPCYAHPRLSYGCQCCSSALSLRVVVCCGHGVFCWSVWRCPGLSKAVLQPWLPSLLCTVPVGTLQPRFAAYWCKTDRLLTVAGTCCECWVCQRG